MYTALDGRVLERRVVAPVRVLDAVLTCVRFCARPIAARDGDNLHAIRTACAGKDAGD